MDERFQRLFESTKKEVNASSEKYVYYVIALSVTCIGFSVVRTSGSNLQVTHLPLAGAVLCWGISIYCGLTILRKTVVYLLKDTMRPEWFEDPEVSDNPKYQIKSEIKIVLNKRTCLFFAERVANRERRV